MSGDPVIPPNSRAVLIGVPHYQDAEYSSYPAVGNSLDGMYSLLVKSGLCGWREEQVEVPDPINAGKLLSRLRRLASETTGVLLLYFVGHGVLSDDGELCLALADTEHDAPDATGLEYTKIKKMLRTLTPASTKIVMLDCCFSGRAIGMGTAKETQLADLSDASGVYTLTAADDFADVPTGTEGAPRTTFTGELLDLLTCDGIPGGPGGLSLGAIFPHLYNRLDSKALPRPSQRVDDRAADFVFARNTAPPEEGITHPQAMTVAAPIRGRSALMAFVDQFVRVSGGSQIAGDAERPVLLVAGSGGSGRSELLRKLQTEWNGKTPTVRVDPRAAGMAGDAESLRPVLAAVLLGLSEPVPGYRVEFPRVILAYIAMQAPLEEVEVLRARAEILERMSNFRDRPKLAELLVELLEPFGMMVQGTYMPGAEQEEAHGVAQRMAGQLRRSRWFTRFNWDDALRWFGDQDIGLGRDPVTVLLELNLQAFGEERPSMRRDIEDLLIGALLADLRESLAKTKGRQYNAVVLLDDADTGSAGAFASALVRVRAGRDIHDPLVVVTTSGGKLLENLPLEHGQKLWDEALLPELANADIQAGPHLQIRLGCLSYEDVRKLTKTYPWPPNLGASRVTDAVYRLTGGYPVATEKLLRTLAEAPEKVEDLDAALGDLCWTGISLEDELFATVVADPFTRQDRLDTVATIAAARDFTEAEKLLDTLGVPLPLGEIASPTLWSEIGPRGRPALHPFVRDLGLRALARRREDHPQSWESVFIALRDAAEREDDQAGRLHHELALGNRAATVDALTAALPHTADEQWLTLLDHVTAIYDPRRMVTDEPESPATAPTEPREVVDGLVTTLHALSDPRLSSRKALRRLYLLAESNYRAFAGSSAVFGLRAQHYERLAETLSEPPGKGCNV